MSHWNLEMTMDLARLQTADDLRTHTDRIKTAYRAHRVTVTESRGRPGEVVVRVMRRDPLRDGMSATAMMRALGEPHGLDRLAYGVTELGETAALDLVQRPHVLVGGTTGAGKSGLENALLGALVTAGASLVLVDPKRVELAPWTPAAVRLATEKEDLAPAVAQALELTQRRYAWMEKHAIRNLNGDPKAMAALGGPVIVVVDELAEFLAMTGKTGGAPLASIAQIGRAAGVYLLLATQNPKAELFSRSNGTETLRSNLSNLIAARVNRREDSDVILGSGSSALGIDASSIDPDTPGVAYVAGSDERVRAAWLDDTDIRTIVSQNATATTFNDLMCRAEIKSDIDLSKGKKVEEYVEWYD